MLNNIGVAAFVAYFFLLIAIVIGWVMNVIDLISATGSDAAMGTIELVLRIVGIFFFPIGAIMGWFF